jgi:phage virion morphogenesis protein
MPVTYTDTQARQAIGRLLKRMEDTRPAMNLIGEIVLESIQTNFETGGRPGKWQPLKPSTILQRQRKGKWPGHILVRSGIAGGLMGAIHYQAFDDKVVLAANKVYAAIHHHGGKAGKGHSVSIPARPYMVVQHKDWTEIKRSLKDWLLK